MGSGGLASKQGISKIEICPLDSDRPLGIVANYYDENDDFFWKQHFDQYDSAEFIRNRVFNALNDGIQKIINASMKKRKHDLFVHRISSWRRNFDAINPNPNQNQKSSIGKLSAKFHTMRRKSTNKNKRPSRSLCTKLGLEVCAQRVTFNDAVKQIVADGGLKLI